MNCPCCTTLLLRHINRQGLYWYCPNCRQVLPLIPELEIQREGTTQRNAPRGFDLPVQSPQSA